MKTFFALIVLLAISKESIAQNLIPKYINDLNYFYKKELNEANYPFNPPNLYVTNDDKLNFTYRIFGNKLTISKPLVDFIRKQNYSEEIFRFILAHEYGHFLQGVLELRGLFSMKELQADCLAGAYYKKTYSQLNINEINRFFNEFNTEESGLKSIFGHGTNSGRINAVNYGYQYGSLTECINHYSVDWSQKAP